MNDDVLRRLVASIRDYAIFVLDRDGCVATWNIGAEDIEGYRAKEIAGEHYRRFFTPEDVADGKPERLLDMTRQNGKAADRGWRVRKDGSRFLAETSINRLVDDAGEIAGFGVVTLDITERIRAEDAERERVAREQTEVMLERVQAFAANIPGLAYRRVLKPDGSVDYPFVAGRYLPLLGFEANPALQNGADLFSVTHPDDVVRLREAMEDSARRLSPLEIEARMILASGDVRWMHSVSTPRVRDGNIVWDAIAFDVTEERQLREHLQLLQAASLAVAEAEDFNSALVVVLRLVCTATGWDYGETWVPDRTSARLKLGPVWHRDESGLSAMAEFSRSLSLVPGEGIIGSVWQTREFRWLPDLAMWGNRHDEHVRVALGANIKSICVVPIIAGEDVLAILSFASFERRGRDAGLASAISGVANQLGSALQRKRAEQALREKEGQLAHMQKMEAIGSLTGGVAHDFNNLLTVIIGNLGLLDGGTIAGDSEARALVTEALAAARRGADLVRRLLAFARQQPLQPERLDVGEHVTEFAKLLGRILGEHIEVVVDVDPDAWPVMADSGLLEAAIANLATNARDAMPDGGRLTIKVARRHLDRDYAATHAEVTPGDYTMIAVSDSGVGIPPEAISRIFEPFFTTKERGKGTGLGLSMVFGFIKQSGGHVSVSSEPGAGTTLRLYLPRFNHAGAQTNGDSVREEPRCGTAS